MGSDLGQPVSTCVPGCIIGSLTHYQCIKSCMLCHDVGTYEDYRVSEQVVCSCLTGKKLLSTMNRHQVIVERRTLGDSLYDGISTKVVVTVDGKPVGEGTFGGEPEDNCESRDYRWVIPLLEKMALSLGAEVSSVERDDLSDEEFWA